MAAYLGIDTSNYTTSVALFDGSDNRIQQQRRLLPVMDGALGLRQSDAVFSHIKQIPSLMEMLCADGVQPCAIGVSLRPRDASDSYMPCFLVGETVARSLGAALGVPVYGFSHQAGHVMAALFSAGRMELLEQEFLAFHVSGGTTDCLLVQPAPGKIFDITLISSSLDLKAGQAVDRVGAMLGLAFPAGKALDALSLESSRVFTRKPTLREGCCCLSGIENICRGMKDRGEPDADVALCCLDYIGKTIDVMTDYALERYPGLPVVYCGGVMSNTLLRERLSGRPGISFAAAQLSSDNAVGTALLAWVAKKEAGRV